MVDYIKLLIFEVDIDRLKRILDFKGTYSEKTGDTSIKMTAKFHFCSITIYETGTVLFAGSIHKLYNSLVGIKTPSNRYRRYRKRDKGYNGNLFTLKNIEFIQNHLSELFGCKLNQMIIRNIEIGINAKLNIDPNSFIKGLLFQKSEGFEFRYRRNFAIVNHQEYDLKAYNKSNHYLMEDNIFRFEEKHNKMRILKTIGIRTFQDINQNTLQQAFNLLIKRFDEIVYFDDSIQIELLTKTENTYLKLYRDYRFWIDDLESNHRDRHKKRLSRMIQNKSENLQQSIRAELLKKYSMNIQG